MPSPIRVKSPVLENIITPEDDSLGAPWYTRFSTAVPNERCSTPRVLAEGLIYIAASERASLIQRSIRNRRISARTRAQSYRHSEDTPESTPPPVKRVNSFPTISASKSDETLPVDSSPGKEMEQRKSGREQDKLFDDRLQQAASDDAIDGCNRDDCDGPVVELPHSHSLCSSIATQPAKSADESNKPRSNLDSGGCSDLPKTGSAKDLPAMSTSFAWDKKCRTGPPPSEVLKQDLLSARPFRKLLSSSSFCKQQPLLPSMPKPAPDKVHRLRAMYGQA